MKIKFKRRSGHIGRPWTQSLPFFANPRGVLTHRVRDAGSIFHSGKYSHDYVHYHCRNGTTSHGISGWSDNPPASAVVCATCEALAIADGCGSSEDVVEQATGKRRHVHIGTTRAVRSVCGCPDDPIESDSQ